MLWRLHLYMGPHMYAKIYDGNPIIKTLREDGGEKEIFYEQGNSIGVWTNVASNMHSFIITGEGVTTYNNTEGNEITISNATGEFTVSYIQIFLANQGCHIRLFY